MSRLPRTPAHRSSPAFRRVLSAHRRGRAVRRPAGAVDAGGGHRACAVESGGPESARSCTCAGRCCPILAPAMPQLGMANVQTSLPDLGDESQSLASPAQERRLGETVMRQIHGSGGYLDDPEVNDYLNELGHRLVAAQPDSPWDFEFFAMADPSVNAFAIPGGFVGVNMGLILMTQTESELASVLAHEITHVTQHHYVRGLAGAEDGRSSSRSRRCSSPSPRAPGRQPGRPGGERGDRDGAGPRHPEPAQLHAAERVRGRPHRLPAALGGAATTSTRWRRCSSGC